ncbi:pseudoazurin [Paracoccus gahaiensis]|uniref:Pseudoazurin n=1 Tax=Paracoccus gahaiensis TaxID=1706839 RepID=A0A4V5MUX0_9RHOB|nr:pseudoazurin [Paracoccus gahaiensis]TJZ89918.1 pseudoazurin [Paracoccus gahaiensis]
MKFLSFFAAPAIVLALAGTGYAADHQVKMLNKGEAGAMVFEPAYVKAEPGDTITFMPTDKGHNVESIKEILPEGVESFRSKINEEYTLTVTEPGLYGIKCTPHYAMGMVGLIQVGEATNLDVAQTAKMPKKARERMDEAIAMVE